MGSNVIISSTLRSAGALTAGGREGYKHLAPLEPDHKAPKNQLALPGKTPLQHRH